MIKPAPYGLLAVAALILAMVSGPAYAQLGRSKAKAEVTLMSSVEAIQPGQDFEIAIRFQLQEGWHLYWINSGESGMPPRVSWSVPEGFTVSKLRFPIPKRLTDQTGITTNILEGETILLATVSPPVTLSQPDMTLHADLRYLLCKHICIMEKDKIELTIPVAADGTAKPSHGDVFQSAHRALPETQSKYLTVTPTVTAKRFPAALGFDVVLNIKTAKGFHIQSHEPLMDAFIKTDVFLEPTPGITFKDPIYPKPKIRTIPVLGKVSEYWGTTVVRIPAEVDEEPPPDPVRIAGVVTYQACNSKGTCFPPAAIQFAWNSGDSAAASAAALSDPPDPSGRRPTTPVAGHTVEDKPTTGPTSPIETNKAADTTAAPATQESSIETVGSNDTPKADGIIERLEALGLPFLLLACFVYGLFINATPCVLPLLSIKVLGFVQQAHESRRRTMMLGLSFGAGVMLFFVLLGLLAGSGGNILQYPVAVIALGAVVMAMSLSMLGVYTLQVPTAATKLDATIQQEGLAASFGKGALAPILGFACTGPLMAGAFGWATQQPPNIAIVAFLFMGLGMASPYVLLAAFPKLLGFVPKPGNWMITFERVMGFLLLAMVVWLIHPLTTLIGTEGLEWTFAFLVAVAFSGWLLGQIDVSSPPAQRWRYRGGAVAMVGGAAILIFGWIYPLSEAKSRVHYGGSGEEWSDGIPWQPWSVREAVRSGRTVFVDFTAAYCTVCKQNKALATNTPEVRKKMESMGIVPYKGDFTTGDPQIAALLKEHNRGGVPLNLIYSAGKPDNPILLRTNLTKSYLLEMLDKAGPSDGFPRTDPAKVANATS